MKDKNFFEVGVTYKNTNTGKLSLCLGKDEDKAMFRSLANVQKSHGPNHKYGLYYSQCQNFEKVDVLGERGRVLQ